jgi:two-component system chemotaxis sensor kinase CheA
LLIIIGEGEMRCAVQVDELLGQQQVVAKRLYDGIHEMKGISGAAILGDGRVGLIIDTAELAEMARQKYCEDTKYDDYTTVSETEQLSAERI